MKVEWSTDNGATWNTLVEHGRESVDGFQVAPVKQLQLRPGIRSTYNRVTGRGNLLHTISFNTHREHPTITAAQMFCMDHAAALPQDCTLRYILEDQSTARQMDGAEIQATALAFRGVSVSCTYRIQGGAIDDPNENQQS